MHISIKDIRSEFGYEFKESESQTKRTIRFN